MNTRAAGRGTTTAGIAATTDAVTTVAAAGARGRQGTTRGVIYQPGYTLTKSATFPENRTTSVSRSLTGSSTVPFHRGGRCFVRLLVSRSLTGSSTVPVHREGGSRQRMNGPGTMSHPALWTCPACGRPLTVALNPVGGEAGAHRPLEISRASAAAHACAPAARFPQFHSASSSSSISGYEPASCQPWQPPVSAGAEDDEGVISQSEYTLTKPSSCPNHRDHVNCPLLTLGLMLDASGFVRRSKVFAGTVREHRTLAGMLEALEAPVGALVVMDRGVATDACVTWLRDNGYRYLVVSRERHRRFDADAAVSLQTQSDQTVHMHKVVSTDPDEVRLYCYSEERAEKERGIVERFASRFETALTKLNDGLSRPRAHKRLDQVWQRIGRLKAKHSRVASHYQITVTANEAGDQAVAVNWTRRPQDGSMVTHPGVYCLRSSETDWNEDALWRTYTTLTDVEAVFRSLKSELGLRPIYHRKPARADGHLFITVIAYQLVQVIRTRLRARREHARWTTLRRVLEGQQRVTATFRRPDGRTLHVRTATQAEPDQRAIYDALGVDPHPGGVRKTLV